MKYTPVEIILFLPSVYYKNKSVESCCDPELSSPLFPFEDHNSCLEGSHTSSEKYGCFALLEVKTAGCLVAASYPHKQKKIHQ